MDGLQFVWYGHAGMVDAFYRGEKVLVTGAAGFIGRHLVARLKTLGADVHGTTRAMARLEDPASLRALAAELSPKVTFHLAARTERDRRPQLLTEMLVANTLSVAALCEALVEVGDARLVLVGSGEDYGRLPGPWIESQREQPVSPYGLSKVAGSLVAQTAQLAFGLRTVTARPSVVYGPGQRGNQFVPSVIAACLAGNRFPMTCGEQLRDFLYVDDLVDGLLALGAGEHFGRVFNLCTGQGTCIADLARKIQSLIGRGELEIGALPYRSSEAMVQSMSPAAMQESFGWRARVSLDDGLARTIAAA